MTSTQRGPLVLFMACALANLVACQREPPSPPPDAAPANTAAPPTSTPATPIPPSAADGYSIPAPSAPIEAPSAPAIAPTVEFAVPRTVTVGKAGDISFTIAEVATEPRNSESMRLVLLVRMLNKQRQAADFSDQNFRLVTKDSVIAANGGLGETVGPGIESALERVQFVVPINSVPQALKIEFGGESTELPLTFKQ
jgi:hypothetical protein